MSLTISSDARLVTAVIQPYRGIGDLMWHLPYLRRISENARDGKIIYITNASSHAKLLLAGEKCISEVIYLRQDKEMFGYMRKILDLANSLRNRCIEQVYILDTVSYPAFSAFLAGIRNRYGFGSRKQRRWLTQHDYLDEAVLKAHPLEKLPAYMRMINLSVEDTEPRLQLPQSLITDVRMEFATCLKPWIGIGVGASTPERIWPAERTAELCTWLINKTRGTVFLLGADAEKDLGSLIMQYLARANVQLDHVRNLAGKCAIDFTGAIISECRLFFGMDSGPINMAAALEVTTFGLFAVSPPLHYSGYLHAIPTDDGQYNQQGGIQRVSVDHVIGYVRKYI
ncbi:MAG: hypothetical protein A2W28_12085 [Gammaproteobacteria bacterium RBG_16_51_14]|nr:MAG: hypothetical protein A2W28_12085 [Gammaproteobacteria bacterium RBG_16_51_14]